MNWGILCVLNVELPVDEKNSVFKKLALQTEIEEFAISTLAEADLKQTDSQEKFAHGKSLFEKADYMAAIKIFKNIENDFARLGISQHIVRAKKDAVLNFAEGHDSTCIIC